MLRRRKWWYIFGGLLAVLGIGSFVGYRWLTTAGLPQREGEVQIAGLQAPVLIRYDDYAVPHVQAESSADLALAIGWLHANERMAQMELNRRAAMGRLSELFGDIAYTADLDFRQLRLREAAENQWRACSEETKTWLEAYAKGVNAWIEARDGDLPPLFKLTGSDPEPWQPVDSISAGVMMAFGLSFAVGRPEEPRFLWLGAMGEERFRDFVGYLDPVTIPAGMVAESKKWMDGRLKAAGLEAGEEVAASELDTGEASAGGSNNWAVGIGRTAHGGALFSNDPHLRFSLPGVWYQVHLRAPDYEASGVTLPGVPAILIGQNAHFAWGFTNTMLDDHDFFAEELNDEGTAVRRGDEWLPLETRQEVIVIRGADPETITLKRTDHGPMFEARPSFGLPARSLSWTVYEAFDGIASFLALARATTLEEARTAAGSFVCPSQNLVAAHKDGGLLYAMMGRIPKRKRGDGQFMAPGWDPSYGWDGLEPPDANPYRLRPAEDWIVTANADIRPTEYSGPLVANFDTPYRENRIRERLAASKEWNIAGLAEVQTDAVDTFAVEVIAALEGEYQGDAAQCFRALKAWDGQIRATGPAALFLLVERELQRQIFDDEEENWRLMQPHGMFMRWRIRRMLAGEMSAQWFDNVETEAEETKAEILAKALERAWQLAAERWGTSPDSWDYGEIHPFVLRNALGAVPVIGKWFNRGPLDAAGSATCVAAFGGNWVLDEKPVSWGPSVRFVADPADPDQSRLVLPGGQAGHAFDPHYDDQIERYLRGDLRPMYWSEEAIQAATRSSLRLHP